MLSETARIFRLCTIDDAEPLSSDQVPPIHDLSAQPGRRHKGARLAAVRSYWIRPKEEGAATQWNAERNLALARQWFKVLSSRPETRFDAIDRTASLAHTIGYRLLV